MRLPRVRPLLRAASVPALAAAVLGAQLGAPASATATTATASRGASVSAASSGRLASVPWPGHPDRALVTYRVVSGDTVTELATHYHAWTRELVALNHLGHRGLAVGQVLRIPVVVSRSQGVLTGTQRPRARQIHWLDAGLSRTEVRHVIERTARRHGVPVHLALAIGWQESGWHQPLVSSAGALGVMQVMPGTGAWLSSYLDHRLTLRRTTDNVTAGVTLLRVLRASTTTDRRAVASYYQGLGALRAHGMFDDTKQYVRSVLAIRDRLNRTGQP